MRGLPRAVKQSLEKARDSALLAIEIYNKPAVSFKSGGYIVLMVIAWTSLFHSVFFKRRIKPFEKGKNGRFIKEDGDYKHWDIKECLRQYYKTDTQNPVRSNLEFFIPLRNKIEHRSFPEIDSPIFAECQAMLLNFDEMIEKEFGKKYCLRESLSFSLQLFPTPQNLIEAVKHNPPLKSIIDFIENYRSTLSTGIWDSGKYAFKAFLIQVANHPSKDALPIQFIHYDRLSAEEKKAMDNVIAAFVKYKHFPVSNEDTMKPGKVIKEVQEKIGNPKIVRAGKPVNKFNPDTHTRCWKKYKVRPDGKSTTPQDTNQKFCIYDKAHNDYVYTQAWVDFLVDKLTDEKEYASLYKK